VSRLSTSRPLKRVVVGSGVPTPIGPYSHAVVAGGFVFLSGQGPKDPTTGRYVKGRIKEHTRQTIRNVQAVLRELGLDLSDVVKVNAYLRDMGDFKKFNEAYAEFFGAAPPARTTLQATLPGKDMLVEIEVLAKTRK
jgi:2-iminobutanoate/2-iminopropanoate deaminase